MWGHGLDPDQAAEITYRPTAMIPKVFKGLTPSNPVYGDLANIPAGAMAQLLGKGTPGSSVRNVARIYQGAGLANALPTTQQLLHGMVRGKGLEDAFQGVKSGPKDADSYYNPGYVAGQEPKKIGEAITAFSPLLDASLYNLPTDLQDVYGSQPGSWGSYLMDQWASRAMKKPAGKGAPIYRYVGRRLFR